MATITTKYLKTDNGEEIKVYSAKSADTAKNVPIDLIYPVGSIYMSTQNVSPASFMGGSWEAIEGKFLLSSSSSYTAGSSGGSADAIVPYHRHSVSSWATTDGAGNHNHNRSVSEVGSAVFTSNETSGWGTKAVGIRQSGGGAGAGMNLINMTWTNQGTSNAQFKMIDAGAHNHTIPATNTNYEGSSVTGANMPPYLVVYMWKRIG